MKYLQIEEKTNKIITWYTPDVHYIITSEELEIQCDKTKEEIDNMEYSVLNNHIVTFLQKAKYNYLSISIVSTADNLITIKLTNKELTFNKNDMIELSDAIWQEAIDSNANCYENGKFIIKEFRTKEEIEEQRILDIKAKAGQIITSRYDIIKQMNIYGEGGDKQIEMVAWIKKIRDISNKAEADGIELDKINWEI